MASTFIIHLLCKDRYHNSTVIKDRTDCWGTGVLLFSFWAPLYLPSVFGYCSFLVLLLLFCNSRFFFFQMVSFSPACNHVWVKPILQNKQRHPLMSWGLSGLSSLLPPAPPTQPTFVGPLMHVSPLAHLLVFPLATKIWFLLLYLERSFSSKQVTGVALAIADEHFLLKTLSLLDYVTKYFLSSSSTFWSSFTPLIEHMM